MNLTTFMQIMNLPSNMTVDEILDTLIIYLRKSRKDMDYYKDESIEKTLQRHEKELQDYIINIFGKPIPEKNIYREVASGDTIEDRPVMQEVLSIIENENKKAVVCIEIERLARGNTIDQGIIAQAFQLSRTKIITPYKIYNLDNDDDLSYFEDGLYQARKYLKYTKKILNRGRKRSVKDGKYIGSVLPYGFGKVKIPNDKGFILVRNDAEASVIELIADLFLNGLHTTYEVLENDTITSISKLFGLHRKDIINNNLSLKVGSPITIRINNKNVIYKVKENDTLYDLANKFNISINDIYVDNNFFELGMILKIENDDMRPRGISHYLNYLKIKPRKATTWTENMVRGILQSYAVYGYLTWDRRKTTKILVNGQIVKKTPNNDDFILAKGKHTPILDVETGKKIKAKFEKNRRKTVPDNKELKNPLLGLVICGHCGNNMTRRPYKEVEHLNAKARRSSDIDKTKLRLLLREHKKNLSLNDIARSLNVSKYPVDHWFASNDSKFSIPYADKWYDLKKLLNITTDEFDESITSVTFNTHTKQPDTLMCSRPRCKCVSSSLYLVEDAIIKSLYDIVKDYKVYVENYAEEEIKEKKNNNNLIKIIDNEINKVTRQLEEVCELLETKVYTQEIFIMRSTSLNEQLNSLLKRKEEIVKSANKDDTYTQRKKAIPILEDVLNKYHKDMSPEEKNILLSSIIDKVIYTKNQGGRKYMDAFKLSIYLLSK